MVGMTPSIEGRITCCREAVQFLLTNYTQTEDITKAVQDLRDTEQSQMKDEQKFFRLRNDAFSHCGNVYPPERLIKMCIDGLTLAINFLVQWFPKTPQGCTYREMIQQDKPEGASLRARTTPISRGSAPRTKPLWQTRSLNMTKSISESNYGQPIPEYREAKEHLMDDYHAPTSVPSSSIPLITLSK